MRKHSATENTRTTLQQHRCTFKLNFQHHIQYLCLIKLIAGLYLIDKKSPLAMYITYFRPIWRWWVDMEMAIYYRNEAMVIMYTWARVAAILNSVSCSQSIVWKANSNFSGYCWFFSSNISNYLKYWHWGRQESIVNSTWFSMTERNWSHNGAKMIKMPPFANSNQIASIFTKSPAEITVNRLKWTKIGLLYRHKYDQLQSWCLNKRKWVFYSLYFRVWLRCSYKKL